jgi:hypothetical protein
VSKLPEIKQRLQRLTGLMAGMRTQLEELKGPQGEEMKKRAKEAGKRMGIGAGISTFGLIVLTGAALYINALLIILFDLFLPLWAAALIIVLGGLFLGAVVMAIGIGIARKAAQDMPKIGGEVVEQLKQASEEMKKTAEELQALAKQEAEERQKQAQEMLEPIKKVAPVLIGAYIGYRVVKRVVKSRKAKKMRIILEEWEEE